MRDLQLPGRSPARAGRSMAATSHPAATAAAVETFGRGGNATDAALTAAGVLSVVEPQMTGIGGDMFAIIAQPDGSLHGINGSGRAPAHLTPDRLRREGHAKVPFTHVDAITVPGALRGFEQMASRFGTKRFEDLLEPAIRLAHDGYPVGDRVAYDWAKAPFKEQVEAEPVLARVFRPAGHLPRPGDRIVWPQLAATLEMIARDGIDSFYTGPIARDIVNHVRDLGGVMTLSDMAQCQADSVTPIRATYRGLEVAELPPNGQGVVALIALRLLERFDLAAFHPLSPERFHLQIEACRAAYSVRDALIGDPATTVDPARLYDDHAIDRLAAQLDPDRRCDSFDLTDIPNSDTIYLCTADEHGQMVSLIYSVYGDFGAMTATEATGIILQNRGACFSLEPGHPNELMGGKRPMHTIIPAMALKDGVPVMAFGVMGGAYQPTGHVHVLGNLLDHGCDPQAALDMPRVFWDLATGDLLAETGVPRETVDGLTARGHAVVRSPHPIGGGQIIWRDSHTGMLTGGSDPRKDGAAIGR